MEFKKNGISIILNKNNSEPEELFFKKGWFIINQNNKLFKEYDNINRLSKVWINYKYKKCKYSKDLIMRIDKMDSIITSKD